MSVAMPQGPEIYEFFEEDEENLEDLVDNVMDNQDLEIDADVNESIYDAFANHYGFQSFDQLEDFVLGEGQYQDQEGFTKDNESYARQKKEFQQMTAKCPDCQDEIREALMEGAMRGELDKSPYIEPLFWTDETSSYKVGDDEGTEYHLAGNCNEHTDVWFHYWERET